MANWSVTDEECIEELRHVADALGKSPTMEEFDEHADLSAATVSRHFDGWNSAKEEADLEWYSGPGVPGDPRHSKRAWYRKQKSDGSCHFCDEDFEACLDFHHTGEKDKEISTMLFKDAQPLDKIRREAEECIILCSNCHRKLHSTRHSLSLDA